MGQGALRRDLVVQRFGGRVPGIAMPVGLTGVLLLNASGIRQHQPAKVLRPRGAEGASGKSLGNDPGEVADVIQVSVRQHNGSNGFGRNGKRFPIPLAQRLEPLEQSAVD